MPETVSSAGVSQNKRHAILLDISLFILDVLSPENILSRYRDDDILLEVPSAFVTMLQDAQSGNSLLGEFIDAHLLAIRNNPIHQRSASSEIQRIILASQEELISIRNDITGTIIRDFAPLINGAVRSSRQNNTNALPQRFPIQRYEPLIPLSTTELSSLRLAYIEELNLSPHPLIDLYFLQVYHAQTVGNVESIVQRRESISIGRSTHKSIKEWRGGKLRRFENTTGFARPQTENDDRRFVQQSRNLLRQFVNNYFRTRWVQIATATTSILIDLVINVPQAGGIGWGDVGIATIGFYSAELINRGITNPYNESPEIRIAYIFAGVILVACVFMVYILPRAFSRLFTPPTVTPTSNLASPDFNQLAPQTTSTPAPPQEFVTATPSLIPIYTPTFIVAIPISSPQSGNVNYCYYVIQPGDTLQSVAWRFSVTDSDLRTYNASVNTDVFVVNQMIYVNSSCCSSIGNNGFSYTVQPGETLYSIAKRNGKSVEALASINNLFDPRYIQSGQMLCIPYP